METEIKIDYSRAREIVKEKLIEKGIEFDGNEYTLITKHGARIELNTPDYFYIGRSYKTVNITINTDQYDRRKRLYLRKFDVTVGDYDLLVEKIKTMQLKNKEICKNIIETQEGIKIKSNELLKILKPYGGKRPYSDTIRVDLKEFDLEFTFYPKNKECADVRCYFNGGEDEAIKLIKKLKGLK